MKNMSVQEKREIILRNVIASLLGITLVILFILFVPLYNIFEEFKITFIYDTLDQIMTKYTFVVVIFSFVIFMVVFYFVKKLMLAIKNIKLRKIVDNKK